MPAASPVRLVAGRSTAIPTHTWTTAMRRAGPVPHTQSR